MVELLAVPASSMPSHIYEQRYITTLIQMAMHHWPQKCFHLFFFPSQNLSERIWREVVHPSMQSFRSNLEFYTHSPIKNPKDKSLISLNLVLPGENGLWGNNISGPEVIQKWVQLKLKVHQ